MSKHHAAPTVAEYMTHGPHSIGADQPLTVAHALMRSHKIRHLPVLSAGALVGMVSQRDLALIESLSDVDPAKVTVEEAMAQIPFVVTPETPLRAVAVEMAEKKYGAVAVVRERHVVGVFTTVDALRALAEIIEQRGAS